MGSVANAALAKAKELRKNKPASTPKTAVKRVAKKSADSTYDKNEVFTCNLCKPAKTITGPWSFKQHQIKIHDKTPEQVGLKPRVAAPKKKK